MNPKEVIVELPYYIIAAAKEKFEQGLVEPLPARLSGTRFYLARLDDDSIIGYGTIRDGQDTEYKIGIRRE